VKKAHMSCGSRTMKLFQSLTDKYETAEHTDGMDNVKVNK